MNSILLADVVDDAFHRTFSLPNLEPNLREKRLRDSRLYISSGMDASVLEKIRRDSNDLVTLESIYRFIQNCLDKGVMPSTVRTYVFYIKRSLRRGMGINWQKNRVLSDQIDGFFRSILPNNPRSKKIIVPSREDIARLIAISASRSSLIIETLYNSGMRVSELCWIKTIDVHRFDENFHEWSISEKGGGRRTIILDSRLLESIQRVFRGKVHLFETSTGKPYDRISAANLVRHSSRVVLGREFGPHLLRHAFATHMLEDYPQSINAIMRIGGWYRADTFLNTYVHNRLEPGSFPRLPEYKPESVEEIPRYSRIKSSLEFKELKNQCRRKLYSGGKKT